MRREQHAGMTDPQTAANQIRDHLAEHPSLVRLGIQVVRAAADTDGLLIRAQIRNHVLTVERHADWLNRPVEGLSDELAHELVGEALDTRRPDPWIRGRPHPRERTRPVSGH
jgi:hypothetical protein